MHHRWRAGRQLGQQPVRCRIGHEDRVEWFGYLDKPERTPELMRRAFTMLRSGRPGPVILAIPNATATYDETADPHHPVKGWKSAPDPADMRIAAALAGIAASVILPCGPMKRTTSPCRMGPSSQTSADIIQRRVRKAG
ncbi:MAG: hypothetical protein JO095_11075 [Alphaproteobacteria bacterium]|nr:hypothetical protein [Alphaproteobacteria bacterium]